MGIALQLESRSEQKEGIVNVEKFNAALQVHFVLMVRWMF